MTPLVVLRPEPGASRTAAQAQAMGLNTRLVPLFTVIPVDWTAPDPRDFDAIVLTSANAVRHAGEELQKLKSLPVHAVGEATAALARSAGFEVASIGIGGSRDMHLPADQRLLHLTAKDHVGTGAARTIAVYEARAIAQPDLGDIGGSVVLVHSPRAGRRLAELVDTRRSIVIAAISPTAASACGSGWRSVQYASVPNDSALLALAARLCESPRP